MDTRALSTGNGPGLALVAPGVHPVLPHPAPTQLEEMVDQLAGFAGDPGVTGRGMDAARIDQLALLERLKGAAAAAQARITQEFQRSQLAQQDQAADDAEAAGRSARAARLRRERGRGIGDQVALARSCPTSQGPRHVGFARAMAEMPHTHDLLTRGQIGEWVATVLVRETAVLSVEDRHLVDERLCATVVDPATGEISNPRVIGMTPRRAGSEAGALAAQLDPEAVVRRAAKSRSQRRVTIRPAPTTMSHVTGLLPVEQGVAVFASLKAGAESARTQGDTRTVGQLMADLFVERLTGQRQADQVPIEVGLVMSAATFTGDSDQPARTTDGTPVPAQVARDLVHDPATPVRIRRLFTDPVTGRVTDVDARRRRHAAGDKEFFRHRDQTCRMPRCDHPIAHADHPLRVADGGETSRANGQGLCEGHNLAKEAPGWRTRVSDPRPGHHEVEIVTPTGHVYRSKAPPAMPPPV